MFKLTGIATVLCGIGLLYWTLALGTLAFALWAPKSSGRKVLWTVVTLIVFGYLPGMAAYEKLRQVAYEKEAWAYFKRKCEAAGERVYQRHSGVRSVVVLKPLPSASEKDLFDQYWYGDPYSAPVHSRRGKLEAAILALPNAPTSPNRLGRGFDFVELVEFNAGGQRTYKKYSYHSDRESYSEELVDRPVSRFAITWEDISTPQDRKYWIAGSRLRILDLKDGSVVADRVGYQLEAGFGTRTNQRRPWSASRAPGSTCPPIRNKNFQDRWFILGVLDPAKR